MGYKNKTTFVWKSVGNITLLGVAVDQLLPRQTHWYLSLRLRYYNTDHQTTVVLFGCNTHWIVQYAYFFFYLSLDISARVGLLQLWMDLMVLYRTHHVICEQEETLTKYQWLLGSAQTMDLCTLCFVRNLLFLIEKVGDWDIGTEQLKIKDLGVNFGRYEQMVYIQ